MRSPAAARAVCIAEGSALPTRSLSGSSRSGRKLRSAARTAIANSVSPSTWKRVVSVRMSGVRSNASRLLLSACSVARAGTGSCRRRSIPSAVSTKESRSTPGDQGLVETKHRLGSALPNRESGCSVGGLALCSAASRAEVGPSARMAAFSRCCAPRTSIEAASSASLMVPASASRGECRCAWPRCRSSGRGTQHCESQRLSAWQTAFPDQDVLRSNRPDTDTARDLR